MRWMLPAAVALSLSGGPVVPAPASVSVVVELFTSEGCSSCPPADQLLTRLATEPSIAGVRVIPLGMHVTYWDQLGWKDPASLKSATDRQQHYGAVWGPDRVYTPQAVVDGREELVGSDEAGLKRAIARAAREPHAALAFSATLDGEALVSTLALSAAPPGINEPLEAILFVTEDGLSSIVKRGENGGRTLRHDAVVRLESRLDAAPGATPATVTIRGVRREWARERLNAVIVVSGRKSHRIWGAATVSLK
jgi:hypothetical protein